LPLSRSRLTGRFYAGFLGAKNGFAKKEILWPENMPRRKKRNPIDMGDFIYGCTVANRGDTKLFNVILKFYLNANSATYEYPIAINPLVPGEPFKFYFVNPCPAVVSTVPQMKYSAQILGESERREYRLEVPKKSIAQYLLMLGPSQVNWTGDRCD
jgi:hypothetical protein